MLIVCAFFTDICVQFCNISRKDLMLKKIWQCSLFILANIIWALSASSKKALQSIWNSLKMQFYWMQKRSKWFSHCAVAISLVITTFSHRQGSIHFIVDYSFSPDPFKATQYKCFPAKAKLSCIQTTTSWRAALKLIWYSQCLSREHSRGLATMNRTRRTFLTKWEHQTNENIQSRTSLF